jgi:hypothetical protein
MKGTYTDGKSKSIGIRKVPWNKSIGINVQMPLGQPGELK